MKILYIILFIQIGWIFPLSAQKQDSIYIGTRHTLFSEILNEERKYWIYVPETKAGEKGKAYPVLYLLDGDSFFHSVVGFTRFFSSSKIIYYINQLVINIWYKYDFFLCNIP